MSRQTAVDEEPPDGALAVSSSRANWARIPERGGVLGIYFLAVCATLFGRGVPRLFLWPIVAYYYVTSSTSRRASREFQRRIRGVEPTASDVFRHLLRFAQAALDRLFFAMGKTSDFDITSHGHEHLVAARDEGRGGILIGSHLGSFAVMRARGEDDDFVINVIVYNANSRFINDVLERFGAADNLRVVDLARDRIQAVLTIKECVRRGEFVALLSDRVIDGSPSAEVDFLGDRADVSVGGFALASVLECPVYLVFGLYRGENRYDVYCEPFADSIRLQAGPAKKQALQELAQQYVDRLAEYCEKAPDNWFNFYDFWKRT